MLLGELLDLKKMDGVDEHSEVFVERSDGVLMYLRDDCVEVRKFDPLNEIVVVLKPMSDIKQYGLNQDQFDKTLSYLDELGNLLEDKIHLLRKLNPNPKLRKTLTAVNELHAELWAMLTDECEICQGASGGVLGNENIIDGVTVCDYCSVELEGKIK